MARPARLRDPDQAAHHVAARAHVGLRDGAAAHGSPQLGALAALVVGGGLACGGASALNHVLDRDIDRLMGPRTASRPVAAGRITPARATAFGTFGPAYLISAVLLDGVFCALAWRLWRRGTAARAAVLFHYSLLYLALLFLAVAVDAVVR